MTRQPVIIIGAPRSGTNMLRDALCSIDGFATWPCDEINPVWKHGQLRYPYDDFSTDQVRPELERFVRRRFDGIAESSNVSTVIEKTCANSLRVAYLSNLLPEARYVFIYRNGADAVASAVKRWHSPTDLGYMMRKLRFVPPTDVPAYGLQFLKNRVMQWSDSERRLRSWGPMTTEIAEAAGQGDVERAAAIQWQQCVEYALDQFPSGSPAASVCYEHFVAAPAAEMSRILTALDYEVPDGQIDLAVANVKQSRSGRGAAWLSQTGRESELRAILQRPMERLGYRVDQVKTS